MSVSVIVMAAGQGTRMRSGRPKPLHRICGRSMVMHVIHALDRLRPDHIVIVVGHGAEQVTERVQNEAPGWANVVFVEQADQLGTGDAAATGMSAIAGDDYDDSTIVVIPGDAPLLRPETLDELVAVHRANDNAATLIVSTMDDPTGYGRIIRGRDERVMRIVEQRDASPEELDIKVANAGMYAFRRDLLGPALRNLRDDNASGEFYLTDVIGQLAAMGHRIGCLDVPAEETQGVNDRWQLALAERELRARTNRRWLLNGVTMLDPRQTFIDVTVRLGRDITLYPGTILQGDTVIGDRCEIGPDVRLVDCAIADDAIVEHTVGREAEVGAGAAVGPYAYLPPGSRVAPAATTGAFYTANTATTRG